MEQSSYDSIDNLVRRINQTYGRVDLLFLNAGGTPCQWVCGLGWVNPRCLLRALVTWRAALASSAGPQPMALWILLPRPPSLPRADPAGTPGRGYGSSTYFPNAQGRVCNEIGQMELVMQTNFWGNVRLLLAVLPLMPKQGGAHNACLDATYASGTVRTRPGTLKRQSAGKNRPSCVAGSQVSCAARPFPTQAYPYPTYHVCPPALTAGYGRILATSSVTAFVSLPGGMPYAASKVAAACGAG
jgi:NAD(P)-dependent dehydrogenase (short-subunit alcohol dehydrogenase family)